eukprot:jgi/Mesen1/2112/ME000151S01365
MEFKMMRLLCLVVFAGLITFSPLCEGLYEDQVGMYDWHQQYIGRVKLAAFQTAGQRKRVYVATEQNVLAALNLRTGGLAWRHVFGPSDVIQALDVFGRYVVTVSEGGRLIRAWSVIDGGLVWDTTLTLAAAPGLPPSSSSSSSAIDFHLVPTLRDGSATHDVALVSEGTVYRLAGHDGHLKWRTAVPASKLFVAPGGALHAVGFAEGPATPAGSAAAGLVITELHPTSGEILGTTRVQAEGQVALAPDQLLVAGDAIVAIDAAGAFIYTAQIPGGSGQRSPSSSRPPLSLRKMEVSSLIPTTSTAAPAAVLPARLVDQRIDGAFGLATARTTVLVSVGVRGELRQVAELRQPCALSGGVPLDDGRSVVAAVHSVGLPSGPPRIALKALAADSGKEEVEEEVFAVAPQRGHVEHVFVNAYTRKSGGAAPYGFRALVVAQDDSLSLLQQGEVVWVREEALASIVDAYFVDLPVESDGAGGSAGGSAGGKSSKQSLADWFGGQWLRAKATLMLATPHELAAVHELRRNGPAKSALTRDHNGFRKLILVLTSSGKLLALHSGNGHVVWSLLLSSLRSPPPGAATDVKPQPLHLVLWQDPHRRALVEAPEVLVIGRAGRVESAPGVLAWVDAHAGVELRAARLRFPILQSIQLPFLDSAERRLLLLVSADVAEKASGDAPSCRPPRAHVFPSTRECLDLFLAHKSSVFFYLVNRERGTITGYTVGARVEAKGEEEGLAGGAGAPDDNGWVFATQEMWQVVLPPDSEVVAAAVARRFDEVVHTQVKILGDRDVLYKYLSKNLLFVATVTPPKRTAGGVPPVPEETALVAYLIDTVTGAILHRVTHVGMQGPVHAVFADNWVVYHYLNLRNQRYEMSVMELYDNTPRKANPADVMKYVLQLGPANLTAPASAWAGPPRLKVLAQSYFFPHTLTALTATRSMRGITAKELLIGTVSDQLLLPMATDAHAAGAPSIHSAMCVLRLFFPILAVDKRFFDPRRTPAPSPKEREEGIIPYNENVPVAPSSYITHALQVAGLRAVITEPSRLESTTLVFAYGVDLFFTRRAPSKMYDSLSEDFSYVLLLVTLGALLVAIAVTYFLSERKELYSRWK